MRHDPDRPLDLRLRGAGYRVHVARLGANRYRVGITGGGEEHPAEVQVERFDEHSGRIVVNGQRFRLTSATHGPTHLVEVDGVTHRIGRDEGGVVRSPAPSLVVATPVAAGDEVEAGAPVLVLESMKMETVLRAPFRARIRECQVSVGSQVEAGAPLMRLEPLGRGAPRMPRTQPAGEAVEIDLPGAPPALPPAERAWQSLRDLRDLLLGFDAGPADRERMLAGYLAGRAELGRRAVAGETELLTVFADLSDLSRNRPGSDLAAEPGSAEHSPREYFHSYLRSLDVERAGVPESFQARLSRVLSHYGVTDLARSPELETAVFRIFLAQQRMAGDAAVVSEVLRQWLATAPPAEPLRERAGLALERLIEATQRRLPAVSDLARGVVFRWFAQPLLRRNRARVYAAVRAGPAVPGPQPGRAGPRGARPGDGGQLRAAGAAPRPADPPGRRRSRAAARGADPPLLRQPAAGRRHRARRRRLPDRHRRERRPRRRYPGRRHGRRHRGPPGRARRGRRARRTAASTAASGRDGRGPVRHLGGPAGRGRTRGTARRAAGGKPAGRGNPRGSRGSPSPSPAPAAR